MYMFVLCVSRYGTMLYWKCNGKRLPVWESFANYTYSKVVYEMRSNYAHVILAIVLLLW